MRSVSVSLSSLLSLLCRELALRLLGSPARLLGLTGDAWTRELRLKLASALRRTEAILSHWLDFRDRVTLLQCYGSVWSVAC